MVESQKDKDKNEGKGHAGSLSRRDFLGIGVAGLASPLLTACGGGSGGSTDSASVQWMRGGLLAALAERDSAVSVALLAGDRVTWSEAFGYANRESRLQATVDTPFNIGSGSKMFAALAVMILRDRGLLSLDQPVAQLLPSFSMKSPDYTKITVRHLISHSSGFPGSNYRNAFNFAFIPGYERDAFEGLKQSRLKHEPGELAVYCNDGFTLVELIVAELTGQRYTDFIQHELLAPLDMARSGFALTPAAEGAFVHPVWKDQMLPQEMVAPYAAGGLFSTPLDMMNLARMMMDGGVFGGRRIVSEGALQDMGVDQSAMTSIALSAPSWRWGLGWDTVQQPGLEAAGLLGWKKGGDTQFFHCDFIVLPQARLAVMMVNDNEFRGHRLALLEGLLLRAAQERGAISAMPSAIVPTVPSVAATAPRSAELTGIYARDIQPIQVLAEADGSLALRFWSEGGWTAADAGLRLRTDGCWWADSIAHRCYAFKVVAGRRYLTQRFLSSNHLYWDELPVAEWLPEAPALLPVAWKDRVGSQWRCLNDDPESFEGKYEPRTGVIGELPERPGYVMWNNEQLLRVIDDNEAGMALKIPVMSGRDLIELRIEKGEDGKGRLHVGTLVFGPKA